MARHEQSPFARTYACNLRFAQAVVGVMLVLPLVNSSGFSFLSTVCSNLYPDISVDSASVQA